MKYCPFQDDECTNEDIQCSECDYAHLEEDSELEDEILEAYDSFDDIGDIATFINFIDENNNDYIPLEESELPY